MDTQKFNQTLTALSPRRKEVLSSILTGKSYEEIASTMGITEATVRKHVSTVYQQFFPELEKHRQVRFADLVALFAEHKPELLGDKAGTPLTNLDFQTTSEEVYIERPYLEAEGIRALQQPGGLLNIKSPRQMGKTSTIARILARLETQGYHVVHLSLKLIDRTDFKDLEQFLRQFCVELSRELNLSPELDKHWEVEGGSKSNCTSYLEDYIFLELDTPLVLCIDDVDLVFPHGEIAEDFLTLIHSWFERTRTHRLWKQLRLIVAYSTEEYLDLDRNHSPFNVGTPLELPELTREQVAELATKSGFAWKNGEIEQIIKTIGGHPHLIQQMLFHLKTNPETSLRELLAAAPTEAGIYRNHLRELLSELEPHPDLISAFKEIVNSEVPVSIETKSSHKLRGLGLITLVGNEVVPRCDLYRFYFRERL